MFTPLRKGSVLDCSWLIELIISQYNEFAHSKEAEEGKEASYP